MKLYAIYNTDYDEYYDRNSKCLDLLSGSTLFFDNKEEALRAIACSNESKTGKYAPMGWSKIHHNLAWDSIEKKYQKDRWFIDISWDELRSELESFKNLEIRELELHEKETN